MVFKQIHQAYDSLQPLPSSTRINRFVLSMAETSPLLSAFASDCSRLGTASFETIHSISRIRGLPRSTAWLLIQYYYAAYFAAHAVLRMLGVSCSNIDGIQTAAINEVIDLYGMANGQKVIGGTYKCSYSPAHRQLICSWHVNDKGGSHQFLWTTFHEEMRLLSTKILTAPGVRIDQQEVASKIDELCDVLCSNGNSGGGWLPSVRNRVNYQQDMGAWFPYSGVTKSIADQMFETRDLWTKDPMKISLVSKPSAVQAKFLSTCSFVIGLARTMVLDMAERHPLNRSFHKHGSVAFLNLIDR
jgi:hypothetical protein